MEKKSISRLEKLKMKNAMWISQAVFCKRER